MEAKQRLLAKNLYIGKTLNVGASACRLL